MIANELQIIAQSGYYSAKDWQAWADNIILNSDEVDSWIYDVSLAQNLTELMWAVQDAYDNNCSEYLRNDTILGYKYMMYRENRLAINDLAKYFIDLWVEDMFETEFSKELAYGFDILLADSGSMSEELMEKELSPLAEYSSKQKKYIEEYCKKS